MGNLNITSAVVSKVQIEKDTYSIKINNIPWDCPLEEELTTPWVEPTTGAYSCVTHGMERLILGRTAV